ncbi:MAG: hypothetical protein VR64_01295 [Desulfatitalea sp. BRH_c12]|nr:MAG: hypothetical protein VR64_01295 [Desulfatitalea sp. BRH_c12]
MTLRLWTTALGGSLICIAFLPFWQRILGIAASWVPVLLVLGGCFALMGWIMNRVGLMSIRRQVAEAAVWERAGMVSEAGAAVERAKSVYDGFWLSPLQRRRSAQWLTLRLARYYLAQPVLHAEGRSAVLSYLRLNPADEAIAFGWLDMALREETHAAEDHDVAERIGAALTDNAQIQRMVMQFYLSDSRSDFEAMQTYRRVWQLHADLPVVLVRDLAHMLLSEACLNNWALQVYLKSHAGGDVDSLEGIAAAVHWLRPTAENRKDLSAAQAIIDGVDEGLRRKLTQRIAFPEPPAEETREPRISPPRASSQKRVDIGRAAASLKNGLGWLTSALHVGIPLARYLWALGHVRRAIVWGAVFASLGLLAIAGWRMIDLRQNDTEPAVEQVAVQATPPVVHPFTIQVAAYLKPEDAQRMVDHLNQQNLDAFLKKAAGSNRTWYQVKVSHFATRGEAQVYGETLKGEGIIDDFYVTNFIP